MRQLIAVIGLLIGIYIGCLAYSKHKPIKQPIPLPPEVSLDTPPITVKNYSHKTITRNRVKKELGSIPEISTYLVKPRTITTKELHCLALNIFHEAKGEDTAGQIGVAQVTLNRLDMGFRNKKTLCGVVFDPKQFSWTADINKRTQLPKGEAWTTALATARRVINGQRIKGLELALHYHADYIEHPSWSQKMILCHVIGQHIYLKEQI